MITSMIFFPEKAYHEMPSDYGFDYGEVLLKTSDNVKLYGWYLKSKEKKGVLVFFHGNAGNISGRLFKAKGWVERGYDVLLVDYRGYGESEGAIKKGDDLLLDAEAAVSWVRSKKVPDSGIVLYGESLGSYPAIHMASKYKVKALILEAPFTSFVDLARLHYAAIPGFLIDQFMRDFQFANFKFIENIQTPLFILHGTSDEICPYDMSARLLAKVKSRHQFFSIQGGAHNDLPMAAGEAYWNEPVEFLESLK